MRILISSGEEEGETRRREVGERWTYSTNAKDIGVLYIIFSLISGIIGTTLSVIIRGELAGYIKTDTELYNVIVTLHGLIMIFFMIMPGLIGGFGNYIIPVMIGALDMARETRDADQVGNNKNKELAESVEDLKG